ncbi:MAG TPA: response regulator [Planctomycetota bacterium]|nr:response regulator [Planctomycetota bacterium]
MSARRVLLVDDNRDLAENIAEILELRGIESDHFDRPRAALEAFVPGRYAAALLDIRMPEMDGIELYRELRRRDPGLPAIAITAYTRDERLRDAIEAGMLAVLPKPVEIPLLLARLGSAVAGERALVVEDDVAFAQNLVELLAERGYSARAVHTCADARRALDAGSFALALVDCRLPDGAGLDLVEDRLSNAGTAVVVFTAFARDLSGARERAGAAGARFLEKPLPVEQLLALIPKSSAASA